MMTHHSVITSSLRKNLKIDKFGDFFSDIDYSSKTDVFRDVICLIINLSPGARRAPLSETKCPQPRSASKRNELVFVKLIHKVNKSKNILETSFQWLI